MPKDANGTELQVGDKVLIPCEVTELTDAEDGHNATLRSDLLFSAAAQQHTNFAINARQTVRVPAH